MLLKKMDLFFVQQEEILKRIATAEKRMDGLFHEFNLLHEQLVQSLLYVPIEGQKRRRIFVSLSQGCGFPVQEEASGSSEISGCDICGHEDYLAQCVICLQIVCKLDKFWCAYKDCPHIFCRHCQASQGFVARKNFKEMWCRQHYDQV